MNKLLNAFDIQTMFGISKTTLDNWIKAGKFPASLQIGHKRLWDEETVVAFYKGKHNGGVKKTESTDPRIDRLIADSTFFDEYGHGFEWLGGAIRQAAEKAKDLKVAGESYFDEK